MILIIPGAMAVIIPDGLWVGIMAGMIHGIAGVLVMVILITVGVIHIMDLAIILHMHGVMAGTIHHTGQVITIIHGLR